MNSTAQKGKKTYRKATPEEEKILEEEGMIKKGMQCPRCDRVIDYIRVDEIESIDDKTGEIKKHLYYYAGHKVKNEKGQTTVIYHYLGSLAYDYVERFNRLGLKGLIDLKRENKYLIQLLNKLSSENKFTVKDFEIMLDSIYNNIDKVAIDEDDKEIIIEKLQKILKKLKS